MSLSNLFKKSPRNGSHKDSEQESSRLPITDDLLSPEMQKKRYDSAMEFVAALKEKTPLVGGLPHAGTVLAVPARLAGSSLYRSLNYKDDTEPGVVVLSEKVNEAWPLLLNQFAFYCKQHGMDVMSKPLVTQFPEQHQPRMRVAQILAEYQDEYQEIMKKHGLGYLEGARAGMIVCSFFFEYFCKQARNIDPFVATGIVAMGIVEGAKTAPPLLRAIPEVAERNQNRLVLGEREAAIQEAVDHGGAFIDPNPGVLSALQAGHIDPYLIYEQALIQKIQEKVSSIDFAKADVDQLFEQWKSKPETAAPMHVRLILWLKKNASAYGYEQNGNRWILRS